MKIGLITDIHEQVDLLRVALARFQSENVDQIVFIGDIVELGQQLEETCSLLAAANVIGVWGNHDYGICTDPSDEIRGKYAPVVLEYMQSLQPRLVVDDCYFSHVEPWLSPDDIVDLWYFQGPPDESHKLERIFDAVPQRLMFSGHYHKWMLATLDGITPWQGEPPVHLLPNQRYFVVVGALCEGRYAVFDTDSSVLLPFNEESSKNPQP